MSQTPTAPGLNLRWLVTKFILGLVALLLLVTLLAQTLRPELEAAGRTFVEQTGYFGMAAGTLLADGFFFPVPPQFYMLLAIASPSSDAWAMVSISVGSVLGGSAGFFVARRLGRLKWLDRRMRSKSVLRHLRGQLGLKTMAVLSATPIAFSWLIYFCGISRYPARFLVLLCALRIPKLLVYYWLVRAGWSGPDWLG